MAPKCYCGYGFPDVPLFLGTILSLIQQRTLKKGKILMSELLTRQNNNVAC
jgi:hypothetical protein